MSAIAQSLPPHSVASERRLMACHVRVRTETGATHCYYALASSTCEATMAAMAHFGHCKVSASAVYPSQPAQPAYTQTRTRRQTGRRIHLRKRLRDFLYWYRRGKTVRAAWSLSRDTL